MLPKKISNTIKACAYSLGVSEEYLDSNIERLRDESKSYHPYLTYNKPAGFESMEKRLAYEAAINSAFRALEAANNYVIAKGNEKDPMEAELIAEFERCKKRLDSVSNIYSC